MARSILIIGEDPSQIDFDAPGVPEDMSAQKVMDGLNGSVERLEADGHTAMLLLTKDAGSIDRQVTDAVARADYDVIVVGAGLRMLPAMAEQFETLINVLRVHAPASRLAFNSSPADSDAAARRRF